MSDYISEDVLIEILKYLRARNIVRLRSVCKSWKKLIDSDELTLKHLALQKPGFFLEYGSTEFFAVELGCQPPLTRAVRCPLQGDDISFNGTHHGIVFFDDGDRNISLWNPSTGKLSSIPLPGDFRFGDHFEYGWGCCKSFCIDPCTKEYQIVILFFEEAEEDHVTVNGILYSSIEKGWSDIPDQEIESGWVFGQARNDLLVQGVAYWTDDLVEATLSFEFSQKTLELIMLPSWDLIYGSPTDEGELIECGDPIEIIQWKGAFSVLCYAANCNDTFEIHSRTEGSWKNMFRFKIQNSPERPVFVLGLAETDEKFWVLYDTYNDMMRKQWKQWDKGTVKGRWMYYHDLYLYESGVGCTRVTSGDKGCVSRDFVESLLFP